MASQKSASSKSKFKGSKPARAHAMPPQMPPQTPAAFRPQPGATTLVPKPPQTGAHAPKPARAPKAESGEDEGDSMKKQELIAKVIERSDVSKKHAKPVIEAMLAVLGEALAEGRDLNLQPLGKVKRKRMKDTGKARVIVANIRQPNAAPGLAGAPDAGEKEAVADDAE